MARKVFFSFHYQRDAVRAGQVRNSNVIKNNAIQTSDFIDGAKWEQVKEPRRKQRGFPRLSLE